LQFSIQAVSPETSVYTLVYIILCQVRTFYHLTPLASEWYKIKISIYFQSATENELAIYTDFLFFDAILYVEGKVQKWSRESHK